MNTSVITMAFVFALGYLGYDLYNFYEDPSSSYQLAKAETVNLQNTINERKVKIEEAKVFFQTLEAKRAELRQLSAQLNTMKSTLSESLDLPQFMKNILAEAKKVGLTVTGLSPQTSVENPYYVEQPFDLTFQGVFVQLVAFLDRLSKLENIIRVDDFSIKPKSGLLPGAKYVETEGNIKVKTYYYRGSAEDQLGDASAKTGAMQ
jgi:Tfp pilus assembly protein PilO